MVFLVIMETTRNFSFEKESFGDNGAQAVCSGPLFLEY